MKTLRFKFISKLILAVFLLVNFYMIPMSISQAPGQDPCDYWRQVWTYWEQETIRLENELKQLREQGLLGSIASGMGAGMIAGGIAGGAVGAAGGGIGLVPGAAAGAVGGGIGGGIAAAINYRNRIKALEADIEFAKEMMRQAEEMLKDCSGSDVTPNCDECTDGNPNCPNASAH